MGQRLWFRRPEEKGPRHRRDYLPRRSVSKLFTDIAVMQLVEQGKVDLDAPITRYLPDSGRAIHFQKRSRSGNLCRIAQVSCASLRSATTSRRLSRPRSNHRQPQSNRARICA